MATREEVKQIMVVIANEYSEFVPADKEMAKLKLDIWFKALAQFDYDKLMEATMKMLMTFTYGTPKLAHLVEIISPPVKDQNEGIEFATRLLDLHRKHGTDKKTKIVWKDGTPFSIKISDEDFLGDEILKEFGKVGYSIYRQIKRDLRHYKNDDKHIFKAQIRDLYNSLKEKEQHNNLGNLPYAKEAKSLIDNEVEELATTMQLEKK